MIILAHTLKPAFVVIICLTFSALIAHGQESLPVPPRHAIKFSPLHLLNPDLASVQLAYEYRFANRFSVQVEGGYVFGDMRWTYPTEEAEGIKLKEEVRWYFYYDEVTKGFDENIGKGLYLSMEFHQNRMEFIRGADRPYRQTGQGIKVGFVRYSAWRFMFDVNLGISFARANMEPVGIPLNGYEEGINGYKIVLPIFGFRMGYWVK